MPPKLPNVPVYWKDFSRKRDITIDNSLAQLLVSGKTCTILRNHKGNQVKVILDKHFLDYYLENAIGSFCPRYGANQAQYSYLKQWVEEHYV